MLKVLLILALAMLSVLPAPQAVAQVAVMGASQGAVQESPEALVLKVSDEVLWAVQAARPTYQDDPSVLQNQISAMLDPVIDFEAFARGVMGRHYDTATPAQRDAFKRAFNATLTDLYTTNLVRNEISGITIKEIVRPNPDRANVVTVVEVVRQGSFTVQYSMRRDAAGQWRGRNIIIDGVNIGLTYRSQFDSAVQAENGDLEAVVTKWPELIA